MLHCLALKKIPLVCYSLAFTKLHDYKKKKKPGCISAVDTEEYPVLKEDFYCLSLPDILCSILWNLYNYYKQFSECVETRITELRQPIEKELKVRENFSWTIPRTNQRNCRAGI